MMHSDEKLKGLAGALGEVLGERGEFVATAESCTGGWLAKVLTDVAGSSRWFSHGLVTYGDGAKTQLLDVPPALLEGEGAVSEATVRAMAAGVRSLARADYGVAISGIAGPDGGSVDKPVGTVWFAWAGPGGTRVARRQFAGDRQAVRRASVACALEGLLAMTGAT